MPSCPLSYFPTFLPFFYHLFGVSGIFCIFADGKWSYGTVGISEGVYLGGDFT